MPKISKRGGYSDRNKIKPINTEIQLKDFDKRTRIQLQNMISRFYKYVYEDEDTYYVKEAVQEFFQVCNRKQFIPNLLICDDAIIMMMY